MSSIIKEIVMAEDQTEKWFWCDNCGALGGELVKHAGITIIDDRQCDFYSCKECSCIVEEITVA